jgi:HAD superfamily hydrolase (TIGR01509 family)
MALSTYPELRLIRSHYPQVTTLLFDMDGTLFDTEIYHTRALEMIGEEFRIIPPYGPEKLHQELIGRADELIYELVKNWPGFPSHWDVTSFIQQKNQRLLTLLSQLNGPSFFASELSDLLIHARKDKLQLGLVTSSEKLITHELLRLVGLESFFDLVLTRDDSQELKPSPWPYLRAMDDLNCHHNHTLIFEDSSVGLTAAMASGAHVIKAQWYR